MRPGTFLLLLLALAGGFVAGWLAGSGGSTHTAAPEPVGSASPIASAAPPRLEVPSARREPRDDPPTAEQLEALRLAMEALPLPPVPRGDGVLTGSVRTPEGRPVAGVEIVVEPASTPFAPWGPHLTELEGDASQLRATRWRRAARLSATSGSDGTYRVAGLAEGRFRVRAGRLAGYTIQGVPGASDEVGAGDARDFVATPVVELTIHLALPDGRAPDEATVHFEGERGIVTGWRPGPRQSPSPMPPGRYRVWGATRTGEHRSEPVDVVLELGRPTEIRLALRPRPMIHGHVSEPEGEELGKAEVLLAPVPDGVEADPALLRTSGQSRAHLHAGAFRFEDLARGRYLLGVARIWRGPVVLSRTVEVRGEPVQVDIELPPLDRHERIVARITGPDGAAPADLTFSAIFVGTQGGASHGGLPSVRRADGTHLILHPHLAVPADRGGTWWLQAQHGLLGTQAVEYVPGAASDVRMHFHEPTTLKVQVDGIEARYQARLRVHLAPLDDAERGLGRRASEPVLLGPGGAAEVQGVQPAIYLLIVQLGDAFGRGHAVHRQPVHVTAEGASIRLRCPALYVVTLRGVSGNVILSRKDEQHGTSFQQVPQGEERAIFDGLPAGEYMVRSGARSASFRLPGPAEVLLD